ncbi:winged helix-turn-helix transcriptional regulator [Nocardia sp. NPDC001965]
MVRACDTGSRTRREYRLTAEGRDLYPILVALLRWGEEDRADPAGPAVVVAHRDCGEPVEVVVRCRAGVRSGRAPGSRDPRGSGCPKAVGGASGFLIPGVAAFSSAVLASPPGRLRSIE